MVVTEGAGMPALANRATSVTLVVMLVFSVLSCMAGAILGIAANGAGVPLSYLEGSPFTSYALPGLILGVVVGGTQLAGAIAVLASHPAGMLLSAIAGFGMIVWIFVELAVMEQYFWMQSLYFILGIAELAAVLALSGIAPRVVAPWKPAQHIRLESRNAR